MTGLDLVPDVDEPLLQLPGHLETEIDLLRRLGATGPPAAHDVVGRVHLHRDHRADGLGKRLLGAAERNRPDGENAQTAAYERPESGHAPSSSSKARF